MPDPATSTALSPRKYPPAVTLIRRSTAGPASAPERCDSDAIEAWLLGPAAREDDLLALFESLMWRLVAAGLALDRASLHVGTLHPQVFGFAWNWNRADGGCDEVRVGEAALASDAYRRNPLFGVIENGLAFRARTDDPPVAARYPLMAELATQGITEYVAEPLGAGGAAYHNAATIATRRAGGFTDAEVAAIRRLFRVFALHVERHIALRIAGNVLDTYLGAAAGRKVLAGAIRRGSGESIRAVVWASDLRGFTDLADRLSPPDMIAVLNAYFERMAGAVIARDGEVLKFIGDGLLAVFPLGPDGDVAGPAAAALAAAEDALAAVERLNADPPAALAAVDGWAPLRSGIALHEGEVFFGNVGAPGRLDFTVIGRAVNTASRVEALSKTLGRPILLTAAVARHIDRPMDHLGEHALRGVSGPIAILSPRR
ncbi:MAG: adenylate/guanylate cyclase domain-containing protein [Rhodospirillales bacterium]|nr:MAG: adenylate/guanylate cyclase domain-containing protein [Rhodospirillales bacterium]